MVAFTCALAHAATPLPPKPEIPAEPLPDPWGNGTRWTAYVIQTDRGVVECRRPYIDSTCRPYVRGQDRRPRAFVRLEGNRWIKCPDSVSLNKCVGIRDLPNTRVQD